MGNDKHDTEHALRQLLELQEHDRRLAGYEIHDGLAQYLAGAMFLFHSYQHLRSQNSPDAEKTLQSAVRLVEQSLQEARRLVDGLRPRILDELGVAAAIEHLIEQLEAHGAPKIEFVRPASFDRLPAAIENALFRIAQEGLNNAVRHSKSERVRLELARTDTLVRLTIEDQGTGFDTEHVPEGHFGLEGIRERAILLRGQATTVSSPGKGTRLVIELPYAE
jgi:signal transduction histidine kinase